MAKYETVECSRCGGKGRFNCYSHVEGGVCFQCNGKGTVQVRVKSAAQIERENARKAAKQAEKDARIAEANRKYKIIEAKYTGDPRIRVPVDHPYYYMHIIELATRLGDWDNDHDALGNRW